MKYQAKIYELKNPEKYFQKHGKIYGIKSKIVCNGNTLYNGYYITFDSLEKALEWRKNWKEDFGFFNRSLTSKTQATKFYLTKHSI